MLTTSSLPQSPILPPRSEWSPVSAKRPQIVKAYARLFAERYPALAAGANGRLERAIEICSTVGACRRCAVNGRFLVKSQSNPHQAAWYQVDLIKKTCTCPDSGIGHLCKHRLAVALHVYGPDWMREEQLAKLARAQEVKQLVERKQAVQASSAQAWIDVTQMTNRFEAIASRLRSDGTYPGEDEISEPRTAMMAAVETATRLSQEYNQLCQQLASI